jgi:putative membrane protein (TIGR04086 family)
MNCKRVLVGGLLAEAIVMVLLLPFTAIYGIDAAATTLAVVPASFAGCFIAALWAARRVASRFVANGAMVGFFAFALYMALIFAAGAAGADSGPQPPIYWVAHACKILGGAAGGFIAGRVRSAAFAT